MRQSTASYDVKLNGIEKLSAKLKNLSYDMKYKGGRFALRKAAQLVRETAKQNAMKHNDPATGRAIADNITEKWNGRLYKTTGDLGFRVGVNQGAKLPKDNSADTGVGAATPHWRPLEFGTSKMKAFPFMRPALDQNAERVADEFIRQYDKAIDRALAKA